MEESIDDNSKKILKVGLVLKNCSIHLKEGIKSILFSKSLLFSFTIIAMIQFILQPFFNYWQPITISKGFAEGSLGMFYIGIQLVTIIAASIYKRLKRISFNINIGIILLSFSLIISLLSENKYIYIILFLLSIIPRHFILIRLNAKAQAQINNSHRSTITSINSMYSRLFSIFVLLIMGVLANYKISPAYTFIICCIIYMLIIIFIYYFSKVQKRKKLNIS
jgi:hypothetical protein